MSGEGFIDGARGDRRAGAQPVHDIEQPMVRIPGYLLHELRPHAERRRISVMRMARVLVREAIAADMVDDIVGAAR